MKISTVEELRALVPEPISKVRLKILDHLERHSQRMIAMSSLVALSCAGDDGKEVVTLLTARGCVVPQGEKTLRIDDPEGALQRAWALQPSARRAVGGLFVVAGLEETLRVNGRAAATADGTGVAIEVEEAFLQCPKAFIRSHLWDSTRWAASTPAQEDAPSATLAPAMRAFLGRSPFALISTESADGHGDVSPRGDPAETFVRCIDERTLLLPDRTGNNLCDSLSNVLSRPRATLVSFVPGEADALQVQARASLVKDEALLRPSAMNGKTPKLGVLLEVEDARFLKGALGELWNAERLVDPKDFPTMGEMILDQVNPGGKTLNKIGSAIFDLANTFHKKRRLY